MWGSDLTLVIVVWWLFLGHFGPEVSNILGSRQKWLPPVSEMCKLYQNFWVFSFFSTNFFFYNHLHEKTTKMLLIVSLCEQVSNTVFLLTYFSLQFFLSFLSAALKKLLKLQCDMSRNGCQTREKKLSCTFFVVSGQLKVAIFWLEKPGVNTIKLKIL